MIPVHSSVHSRKTCTAGRLLVTISAHKNKQYIHEKQIVIYVNNDFCSVKEIANPLYF